MSETKFEILPNEILFQCFNYLEILDIFHSFNQLNSRLNILIRNIPFPYRLNFQNIYNRFQCEQFCRILSTNQTLKNQLYSLHLSNKNTCYPIGLFISKFSLLQFPHLRSLTLNRITKNNWKSIVTVLSSIRELSYFRMFQYNIPLEHIIPMLPISQFQTLIIPYISFFELISDIQLYQIIHLSIRECHLHEFFIILNKASKLNYLKVENIQEEIIFEITDDDAHNNSPANNLKTLDIGCFQSSIDNLFILLKRTPNLKNFILLSTDNSNMINALKWQNFISFSLPHLKNFKFNFCVNNFSQSIITEQILKEFSNNIWFNKYHWYTEYVIGPSWANIYTIPYSFDTFLFSSDCQRYYNETIDHINTFNHVKDLTINPQELKENNRYYFSNIESLSFGCKGWNVIYTTMIYSHVKYIETMINLSNIKHLILINGFEFATTDVFKQILKYTIQLTSLTVNFTDLIIWFNDDDLCKYLNKYIKILDLSYVSCENSNQLEQFSKVFENLEQLRCFLNQSDILFLIKHLHKLICIQIYEYSNYNIFSIKEEVNKFGLDIIVDFNDYGNLEFIYLDQSKLNRNIP